MGKQIPPNNREYTMSDSTNTNPNLSSYQCAKLVNSWLSEEGLDKVIPSQMIYNYTSGQLKKGKTPMIVCHKDPETNKVTVTLEDLKVWYTKYSNKVRVLSYL